MVGGKNNSHVSGQTGEFAGQVTVMGEYNSISIIFTHQLLCLAARHTLGKIFGLTS